MNNYYSLNLKENNVYIYKYIDMFIYVHITIDGKKTGEQFLLKGEFM